MNRVLVPSLVASIILLAGAGEAAAATFRGTAFDLQALPQPRLNRNVPIFVTGITLNAARQPVEISLPPSTLRSDGTYEVIVNDPNIRAVSLFFLGSRDGLQNVRLDRQLNQRDQTVDISLPNAMESCSCYRKRCGFFRR